MNTIRTLGEDARQKPDDWASNRQILALNRFFTELENRWPKEFDERSAFSDFCLKATDDEMIDEVYRILGDRADLEVL